MLSANPFDDVVDVGVVSSGGAVAVDRDRFAVHDQAGELMDGQVRALPGAVDGEEPQGDGGHLVQVGEGVAQRLAREFGCGVR